MRPIIRLNLLRTNLLLRSCFRRIRTVSVICLRHIPHHLTLLKLSFEAVFDERILQPHLREFVVGHTVEFVFYFGKVEFVEESQLIQ